MAAVPPPIESVETPAPSPGSSGRAWRWATLALGLVVLMPLLVLAGAWTSVDNEVWRHLADTVLGDLVVNSLVLMTGVAAGTLVLGVGLAWLTVMCEFPGRRVFDWALMLPFAIPTYVLAFVFLGLLDFTGPVQTGIRSLLDLPPAWFVDVRGPGGIIAVMVLVLYPYVYMLSRVAFLGQGQAAFEAARVLGMGSWSAFFRVALPMARPGIVAGLSLALMEALADFGAVSVFNFDTFTTAIYKAWFGLFNLEAAAQLASILLLFVAVALITERSFRGRSRYHTSSVPHRFRLTGWRAWLATGAAGAVLLLAFVAPVAQLAVWAWDARADLDQRYWSLVRHTLSLGAMAAVLTVVAAFVLAYTRRNHGTRAVRAGVQVATLGYALPGSVLAVGIMVSLVWVDHRIEDLAEGVLGTSVGLLLSGSVLALLLAYFTRFLAVAYGPLESALERIRPSVREAARGLGAGPWEVIRRIYLPMLSPGLFTAGLLVLVDVMKEMPATLLLRPFGWDTLAVRIYGLTAEGEWERAALPAVALVLVGLVPVMVLVRRSARLARSG
ncbi:MAG: iron ABC transporter permease [Chromatiales bacterium]